jgi:hypothetical protein
LHDDDAIVAQDRVSRRDMKIEIGNDVLEHEFLA